MIQIDTHVVVWLWLADTKRLRTMRSVLEEHDLLYSPMVELELCYLHEIGRLRPTAAAVTSGLSASIGLSRCAVDFGRVVDAAHEISWTRDPFDRLIVATSLVTNTPLLTSDKTILRHHGNARAR